MLSGAAAITFGTAFTSLALPGARWTMAGRPRTALVSPNHLYQSRGATIEGDAP